MLKIKDDVDLKELEKFGLEYEWGCWWFDYKRKRMTNIFYVDRARNIIFTRLFQYTAEEVKLLTILLYDLIQAGLVEKVEE